MISIAIHGGAGTISRREMSAAVEARYRAALERAVLSGHQILQKGGTSLDAVCAAVVVMEDSPLFNAGRGACYNADEKHELDASVMDGATRRAGAIAAVSRIRNPVLAARAVMEQSRHVLLVARGAEHFARKHGVRMAPAAYFHSGMRLAAVRQKRQDHHGTVGAVALDARGNLAAATSTGGYTGKLPGRVGDSPIIGAGNFADDTCAVSATGLGEAFIRGVLAYDVAARLRYLREPLAKAARAVIGKLADLKGDGGLIAIDRRGNIVMPFNSQGMYRACIDAKGKRSVAIYR